MEGCALDWLVQVEIVRFRTDTTSVASVIVERAATLDAAAVVRLSAWNLLCASSAVLPVSAEHDWKCRLP